MSRTARIMNVLHRRGQGDQAYINSILNYSPIAFYDASVSPVWQDSAGTTPADEDADVVGRWDDLSGNDYHATQVTTANKPLLRLTGLNGKPAIDPDGVDDSLVLPVSSAVGSYTFCAVLDLKSGDLDSSTRYLMDSATGRLILGFNNIDFNKLSWFDDSWKSPGSVESVGLKVVTWKLSGGNGTIYRNGINLGSEAYSAKAISETGTRLFSSGGGSANLTSPVSTFLIFNTALSDADRIAVQDILNSRYGVY